MYNSIAQQYYRCTHSRISGIMKQLLIQIQTSIQVHNDLEPVISTVLR